MRQIKLGEREEREERERERGERGKEMDIESGLRQRKKKVATTATETETPPANDCCPICFSDFTFPCRTDCNHWFCASCILEYWHYGVALKPCKCPLCSSNINRLTPEASLHHSQELQAAEALKNIQQYNSLFVGGTHGLLLKIWKLPLLLRRLLQDMMDPNNFRLYLQVVRLFSLLLGILFYLSGGISDPRLLQFYVLPFFLIIHLIGRYRRRRLLQHVRQLAASHP